MNRPRLFTQGILRVLAAQLTAAALGAGAQNYSDIWYNPAESGWGLTIADHETQIFAVWYTYRADGSPTWFTLPGGTFSQGRRLFTGDLYQTTGPAYNAPVFNPNAVTATKVGSATLDFAPSGMPAGTALFTYTLGSVTRTRSIQRQVFGNAAPNWGTDFTDIWFNPEEAGWGMTLAQHGNNVFGVWFTYETNGLPLWVVMPGVTFSGPMNFTGNLYTTRGPFYALNTFDPSQVQVSAAGTMSFSFQGAAQAGAKATFPTRADMSGVFRNSQTFRSIVAQPFGNAAPAAGGPLAIQLVPLEPATAGAPYLGRAATASGGAPPYTFYGDTFANGAPPLGTGIEANGFLSGTVSATYTSARTFTFGVCVRDTVGASICLGGATIRVVPASSTITWNVGNQCNNGQTIQYKFFDTTTDDRVWPSATTHYVISYGQSYTDTLSCTLGNKVCIGARSSSQDLYWGVGFGGTSGCTACCGTCGNGTYAYNFGCSGQGGGTSYYANWTCGGSSQCAAAMGGSAGSKGPFCSLTSCNNWGQQFIPAGYTCSTSPIYSPSPGGSQCYNYP